MFLKVMQWSNHCVLWQIDFVGVAFGLRPRFFVCVWFGSWSGLLLSLTKRKSGWGICGSSWFVSFVDLLVCFDLPALMDQLCPCTNIFSQLMLM